MTAAEPVSTIVLVGHCGPDTFMLRNAAGRFTPDAAVIEAKSNAAAEAALQPGALLLVNRVLDGDFPDDRGIELIRDLARRANGARLMLISNFEDAQTQAVAAGAEPGFGKADLYEASTGARMRGEASPAS